MDIDWTAITCGNPQHIIDGQMMEDFFNKYYICADCLRDGPYLCRCRLEADVLSLKKEVTTLKDLLTANHIVSRGSESPEMIHTPNNEVPIKGESKE